MMAFKTVLPAGADGGSGRNRWYTRKTPCISNGRRI